MSEKRKSKIINKADTEYLINLTREDITNSCFMDMFGEFDGPPRFQPFDLVTIPKGGYGRNIRPNKNEFTTTVGLFIFNKIFIETRDNILKHIGWSNETINKKAFGRLFDKLGYLLLENKIDIEDYKYFCNSTQLMMPLCAVIANSFTEEMLYSSAKINKKKAEILKKNEAVLGKERLTEEDLKVVKAVEGELLDYAKELLKDDPSMDMYDCGGYGDYGNNFKNMFVMKGANKDPDPTKGYMFISSNYIDGVSPEDYTKMCNTLAEGPYARAKKTESGVA